LGRIVIITGTDTGVGKTWVGCRLAEALHRREIAVRTVKLVETGTDAEPSDDEDGVRLARAAGQEHPRMALRRYRTAVAPAEAADLEQRPLDINVAEAEMAAVVSSAKVTLVEGAGGLFSPLTWQRNLLDVARKHAAPVLVVAADRLGTVNHTLLTLGMLDFSGARYLGVVMNAVPGHRDRAVGLNANALRKVQPGLRVVETANGHGWIDTVLEWLKE
jgi:dethiobiotin synthetase